MTVGQAAACLCCVQPLLIGPPAAVKKHGTRSRSAPSPPAPSASPVAGICSWSGPFAVCTTERRRASKLGHGTMEVVLCKLEKPRTELKREGERLHWPMVAMGLAQVENTAMMGYQ